MSMMMWRGRWAIAGVLASSVLATTLAGCGRAPRDTTPVPSVTASAASYVMAPQKPSGLFLKSMNVASPSSDRLVVYAEPGRGDPLTGRALAVTKQHDRNGILPEGSRKVGVRRFGAGRIGRQGDFTWIGWAGTTEEGEDPPYYGVIGRGLTEHEIRAAADAVDKKYVRIARSGMPKGLQPIVDGPMSLINGDVSFGAGMAQRWTAGPDTWMTLSTMRGDRGTELLAHIMTFGRPARIRGTTGMAGSVVYPVGHTRTLTRAWREGDVIVVVSAQGMSEPALDAVIADLRPVRGSGMERLRASILRYPPERLGDPGEYLVASGHNAHTMWAIFVKPLGHPGEYMVTERGLDSGHGLIGGGSSSLAAPRKGLAVASMAEDKGTFIDGAAAADVARVRLTRTDGTTIGLPLSRPTKPDGTRWFGTWVEGPRGQVREVVACDAQGHVVERKHHG
jgi:hypothetical protein